MGAGATSAPSSSSSTFERRRASSFSHSVAALALTLFLLLQWVGPASAVCTYGPTGRCDSVNPYDNTGTIATGQGSAASCPYTSCRSFGPKGCCRVPSGCYCSVDCTDYGDCCSDFASVCRVPTIKTMSPSNGPTAGDFDLTLSGVFRFLHPHPLQWRELRERTGTHLTLLCVCVCLLVVFRHVHDRHSVRRSAHLRVEQLCAVHPNSGDL